MSTTYQPSLPASITGLIPHALSIADTGYFNRKIIRLLDFNTVPLPYTPHKSTLRAEN